MMMNCLDQIPSQECSHIQRIPHLPLQALQNTIIRSNKASFKCFLNWDLGLEQRGCCHPLLFEGFWRFCSTDNQMWDTLIEVVFATEVLPSVLPSDFSAWAGLMLEYPRLKFVTLCYCIWSSSDVCGYHSNHELVSDITGLTHTKSQQPKKAFAQFHLVGQLWLFLDQEALPIIP